MNIVTDFYSLPFLLVAVTTASICDVGLEECFLCTVRLLELHTLPNELLSTLIRQLPYSYWPTNPNLRTRMHLMSMLY